MMPALQTAAWRTRLALAASLMVAMLLLAGEAGAQTVRSITASSPDLGNVVSGSAGVTVFRVASGSGAVTRVSGTGVRLATSSTRPLVTVGCDGNNCANKALSIRVGNIGSPSGRAGLLDNFAVTAGSATFTSAPTGTNPVSFTIAGLPRGGSATFFVGLDFPIAGNDAASATGAASSGYYVYVAIAPNVPTTGSTAGLAVARVFRPITVAATAGLAFGNILRPTTGTGSVAVSAATGQRTFTGTGTSGVSSPTPTRATFTVSGEGGQTFSLGVPPSFNLVGPGASLTVSLASTAIGAQTLSSALGSDGAFTFGVGGSFPLASTTVAGFYQGSFAVTVQYN